MFRVAHYKNVYLYLPLLQGNIKHVAVVLCYSSVWNYRCTAAVFTSSGSFQWHTLWWR